jgi:hypothetical protein
MRKSSVIYLVCAVAVIALFVTAGTAADYMKLNPPPDVDKEFINNSCWLAAAANMLAGADYGYSSGQTDVQLRAEYIYGQLVGEFGVDR